MSTCSSCQAPIVWAKTKSGARTPFDAEPIPAGTWRIDNGVASYVGIRELPVDVPLYESHFGTCPNADHHRRRP